MKTVPYNHAYTGMCLMDAYVTAEAMDRSVDKGAAELARKLSALRSGMGSVALRDWLLTECASAMEQLHDLAFPDGCGEYGVAYDFDFADWFVRHMLDFEFPGKVREITPARVTNCLFGLLPRHEAHACSRAFMMRPLWGQAA